MFWRETCDLYRMILMVWSSDKAPECAKEIERALEHPVRVVENLEAAYEHLKTTAFFAVVIDQWAYEAMLGNADVLFRRMDGAVPVILNFAISSSDHAIRTIRTALLQHEREMRLARENASALLMAELKEALTALLLSCGLALREPTLALPVALRLRRIEDSANQIRRKLAGEEQQTGMHA
jgi:hypothetical protein